MSSCYSERHQSKAEGHGQNIFDSKTVARHRVKSHFVYCQPLYFSKFAAEFTQKRRWCNFWSYGIVPRASILGHPGGACGKEKIGPWMQTAWKRNKIDQFLFLPMKVWSSCGLGCLAPIVGSPKTWKWKPRRKNVGSQWKTKKICDKRCSITLCSCLQEPLNSLR